MWYEYASMLLSGVVLGVILSTWLDFTITIKTWRIKRYYKLQRLEGDKWVNVE